MFTFRERDFNKNKYFFTLPPSFFENYERMVNILLVEIISAWNLKHQQKSSSWKIEKQNQERERNKKGEDAHFYLRINSFLR